MKKQQREKMYRDIERHGEQLNTIFNTGLEPVALCKKLRRIERKAHAAAVDYCNGYINDHRFERDITKALAAVVKILGPLAADVVFINGDPRGYALKIDDAAMIHHGWKLYRDMGGYGIISPDFTPVED